MNEQDNKMTREEFFRASHRESGSPFPFPEKEFAELNANPEMFKDRMLGWIEQMYQEAIGKA